MVNTYSYGKLDELGYEQGRVHIGDVPFLVQDKQSLVTVSSTNAVDSQQGVGAKTVQLIGPDKDYVRQSEIVQLNGTEPVTSKNQYIFIERAEVVRTGADNCNKGSLFVSGVHALLAQIHPYNNRMRSTAAVVYKGFTGNVHSWGCAQGAENRLSPVDCTLNQRLKNGIIRPLDEVTVFPDSNGDFTRKFNNSLSTPKSSIFYVVAQTKGEGVEVYGSLEVSLESKL